MTCLVASAVAKFDDWGRCAFQLQRSIIDRTKIVESEKVQSSILYEGVAEEKFPHIYGPLNIDAVTQVIDFEPNEKGEFELTEVTW